VRLSRNSELNLYVLYLSTRSQNVYKKLVQNMRQFLASKLSASSCNKFLYNFVQKLRSIRLKKVVHEKNLRKKAYQTCKFLVVQFSSAYVKGISLLLVYRQVGYSGGGA